MTLKEWRLAKGLTQVKLAQLLGIEQAHLSKLDRRAIGPSLPLAQKILEVTQNEVTLPDLQKLKGEPLTDKHHTTGI